jgi:hypothetical protein
MPGPMLNPSAATPEAFGAGIGRALQNVGGTLQQIYREEQEKADNLALTDAVSKAYQSDTKHRYSDGQDGGMVGISVMQGDQLFANASKVAQSFQNDLNGISEGLNPNQRIRFMQATQSMRASFESSMAIRIAQERQKKAEAVSDNALFTIDRAIGMKATNEPDSVDPISIRETVEAITGAIKQKYDAAPSKPAPEAIELEINKEVSKITDEALKSLIRLKRYEKAMALMDDSKLANAFSAPVKAWAQGQIKEHKEKDGSIGVGQRVWENTLDIVNSSKQALVPEQVSAAAKRAALEEIRKVLPGDENAEARAKAIRHIESLADNHLQQQRTEQSAIADALYKELINGKRYAEVRGDFRHDQLSFEQQQRLAAIDQSLHSPSTEAAKQRLGIIKSQWESNSIPPHVKDVIADWPHIAMSTTPNIKELFDADKKTSAEWIIAEWLSPKIKDLNSNSTAQDFKDRQAEVSNFWPKTAEEMAVVTGAKQSFEAERKKPDPWLKSLEDTTRTVAKDLAEQSHPGDAEKRKEFETKLFRELLNTAPAYFGEQKKKQQLVDYQQMRRFGSKMTIDEAVKENLIFRNERHSFRDLAKLKPQELAEFEKKARIPYEKIGADFLAEIYDYADSINEPKPTEKKVEEIAYRLWKRSQEKARPNIRFE